VSTLQALLLALTKSTRHAFDSACEAATLAACVDGYRGPMWIVMGSSSDGGFNIDVFRDREVFEGCTRDRFRFGFEPWKLCRLIEITEEGAQQMLALMVKTEGDDKPTGAAS
jgi:hypothetical protein